ncbi:aquaporin [Neolentinus lepideus HHB14362 ss-1]|uniref:Aquaporin n=1 Tax=Neolentinus lepideus HHB14362 ss-1 TaxID=1314782 RepID=A0A165TYC4_9AGAM|nr:aquaporin [Neolentinus lepideus HHB14362 ss-1]
MKDSEPTIQHIDRKIDSDASSVTRSSIPQRYGDHEHVEFHQQEGSMAAEEPEEHITPYPNRWARIRSYLREPAAEFLGTMILIIFGAGVDCQVVLSSNTKVASSPKGDYLSLNCGWAIGTALGVWISGGVSGGHINPAVTLALATWRGFPWKKVPIFIFAQLMGGLVGAAIVYANYFHAIDLYEGGRGIRTVPGTASLFSTYALPYMTSVSCFFSEFMATAVLLLIVLSITDKDNGPPPAGLVPLSLFFAILGIGAALGMETGYAINPARDLGPRLLTAMVGYGKDVFTFRNQYWLWCPVLGPILGAQAGTLIYDSLIFTGAESILNKPDARARAERVRAAYKQREKPPAGTETV